MYLFLMVYTSLKLLMSKAVKCFTFSSKYQKSQALENLKVYLWTQSPRFPNTKQSANVF